MTLLAISWPFLNFLNVNKTMLGAPQIQEVFLYLCFCIAAVLIFWVFLVILRVPIRFRVALDMSLAVTVALFFLFPAIMAAIASAFALWGVTNHGGSG